MGQSNGKGPAVAEDRATALPRIGPGPAPDTATAEGPGLTLRAAAVRLGIGEKTLRKRIQEGAVRAEEVAGKFGKEWRVHLPEARASANGATAHSEGEPAVGPGLDVEAPGLNPAVAPPLATDAVPSVVPAAVFRELLERHEAATVRLGYLQAQAEQMKALQAAATELAEKAAAAEERARREADELRRRVTAAESALESERSKGFWARVFGR